MPVTRRPMWTVWLEALLWLGLATAAVWDQHRINRTLDALDSTAGALERANGITDSLSIELQEYRQQLELEDGAVPLDEPDRSS